MMAIGLGIGIFNVMILISDFRNNILIRILVPFIYLYISIKIELKLLKKNDNNIIVKLISSLFFLLFVIEQLFMGIEVWWLDKKKYCYRSGLFI